MIDRATLTMIEDEAATAAGLRLLVLFGSRARGDPHEASDWDFGYLGSSTFDPDRLLPALIRTLGTDRVDLADLRRAGALLRFRAARDGQPLYEAAPDEFARFWLDAVSFWCDVAPMVREGYEAALARLGP